MASTPLTYPGVYIEELPSGQHTITGVATSIAVFMGWAPQGSIIEPVMIESFAEYQRTFGGLNSQSLLGYAVNQFFTNGGTQAYIVRLIEGGHTATHNVLAIPMWASSPGAWGNNITVTVTQPATAGVGFTLAVSQVVGGVTTLLESYSNLSVSPTSGQYVVSVIDNDSAYVTFVDPANPTGAISVPTAPAVGTSTVTLAAAPGADGTVLDPTATTADFTNALFPGGGTAPALLEQIPLFNILCVPAFNIGAQISKLQDYCALRRAFLIVDSPQNLTQSTLATKQEPLDVSSSGYSGSHQDSAAYYFPWVTAPDPLAGNRAKLCPPCGFVAGIYAATDASRGVWKAPAGIGAGLSGLTGLQYVLSDAQNGQLNPHAINCLRQFNTYGNVVWGARTMAGADVVGSQWKYVPVRRLALFLESSLYYGTQWAVFEPNDEPLWGQLRMNVGTFLQSLFQQGAFAGSTPQQAYFVKCDHENNPDSSIALGIVNVLVGFAPLNPAEFVVIQIQQIFNS
jgi:phage tail sheath protein FI